MISGSATALPTASPAAELHACLDRVVACDVEHLSGAEQADLVTALAQAESRIVALRFRVLAAADRSKTGLRTGAANTGQWAAKLTRADEIAAQREVRLAQALQSRAVTRAALTQGLLQPEHAAVIVQADKQLPPQVTAEQRNQIEAALVEKAKKLAPASLRKAARRAIAAVESDPDVVNAQENENAASEEERARTKTRLSFHANDDGTITGHFTVPIAQGELLKKIIETMTAPRRGRLGASAAQVGEPAARTDWDRARGEAFIELIEHLPTDHLHPKTAATLVVTVEEATLRDALKVANLDTGGVLSAGEARRMACTAQIIPAVMNGRSVPLDLGRSARLFSDAQRLAVGLKYSSCAADGCERPYAWCELHHLIGWALGGRTDLEDARPLCHFHHQRVHDPHYRHKWHPDGSITFHLRG